MTRPALLRRAANHRRHLIQAKTATAVDRLQLAAVEARLAAALHPELHGAGPHDWADALAAVDPPRHARAGRWFRRQRIVQSQPDAPAALGIGVEADGSYEMLIRFRWQQAAGRFQLELPHKGGTYRLTIDADGTVATAPHHRLIDDRDLQGDPTARHTLIARVLLTAEDAVQVETRLDGRLISRWNGTRTDTPAASFEPVLHAEGAALVLEAVRLRALTGGLRPAH